MGRHLNVRLRRLALDWLAPLAVVLVGLVDIAQHAGTRDFPGPAWRHVAFLLVAAAALGLRARAPLSMPTAAILVVTGWTFLWPVGAQGPFEGFLLLVGAAYCLGSNRDRTKLLAGGAVLLGWFVVGLFADLVGGRLGDLVPLTVWLFVGFAVGVVLSRRTEEADEARTTARVMAAEQARLTEEAIEEERARIARELHDVVAHGLTAIVVQSGAERRSLGGGAEIDLDSVDAVLGSIEKVARDALVDLRRLLGLLRRVDGPPALTPQPGLAQLDDLVAAARGAGLDVRLEVAAGEAPLPPGLDLTTYRIVQEAVTNVLKHASGARTLWITIGVQRGQLDVQVRDDGAQSGNGVVSLEGSGHGLVGMRERVKVFGGTVRAGVQHNGGWAVHARLPVTMGEA